jgi:predicted acetyltransferase
MATEYRPIRGDAEYDAHAFIDQIAFNDPRGAEATERRRAVISADHCHGAFVDGELAAGLIISPFQQYLNGGVIPIGGIGAVSCLPEYRRAGYVGGLLRYGLEVMRERGQCLSGLYTPHHALYGRFGWEASGRVISHMFEPKKVRLRLPRAGGRMRRVNADEWRTLHDVYTRKAASLNGMLVRDEARWRNAILGSSEKTPPDIAVWYGDDGEARGYLVYKSIHQPTPTHHHGETTLRVFDWTALDREALSAILSYAISHDLNQKVVFLSGGQDALHTAFEEPNFIEERGWWGVLLRIVDVQQALELRPALDGASGRAVTIALTDATAPWNAGTWHIACSEGRIAAERTQTAPQIEMDVRELAPIYNGFVRPQVAARAGMLRVRDGRTLDDMAAIFSVSSPPYCQDEY